MPLLGAVFCLAQLRDFYVPCPEKGNLQGCRVLFACMAYIDSCALRADMLLRGIWLGESALLYLLPAARWTQALLLTEKLSAKLSRIGFYCT